MEGTRMEHLSNPMDSLPPGFRFHPTDEELILHYLKNQAASIPYPVSIIAEVDIYKYDPWDLPDMTHQGSGFVLGEPSGGVHVLELDIDAEVRLIKTLIVEGGETIPASGDHPLVRYVAEKITPYGDRFMLASAKN